jgi:phosphoribosylamine--glycine ligase
MKVLVVGRGGREHALAWKLAQSPSVTHVFCAPGNAGTSQNGINVDIGETDIERLLTFAVSNGIDLTVVGPEAPLVAGIVNAFEHDGQLVFGPSQQAAELEGSKIFAKELMRRANVPTADFRVFDDAGQACNYIEERPEGPLVVKADGLAAGKGVAVAKTKRHALEAVHASIVDHAFGAAGDRIVVEECLSGQEVSILALIDGSTIVPLEASQDHKPAYDDDRGPNTGGMGAYTPTPLVTPEIMSQIIDKVLVPTVHTMKKEGRKYRGILYAGLMLTSQGPKVLEYNVRFGDPEVQPLLLRLRSDLAQILLAAAKGELADIHPLEWDPRPAVCVVMASEGYPGQYETGKTIHGLEAADELPDVRVFHAGTVRSGDDVVTAGGRVLGVTALGDSLANAKMRAYQAVKCIRWSGAWCRKDISDKARLA